MGVGLWVRKTSQLSCKGKGVWLPGVNQSACVPSDVTASPGSDSDRLCLCGLGAPSQELLPVGCVWPLGLRGSSAGKEVMSSLVCPRVWQRLGW